MREEVSPSVEYIVPLAGAQRRDWHVLQGVSGASFKSRKGGFLLCWDEVLQKADHREPQRVVQASLVNVQLFCTVLCTVCNCGVRVNDWFVKGGGK